MTGTIFKRARKKGKPAWRLQVSGGFDEEGKRVRVTKTFDTKAEAEDELDRLKRQMSSHGKLRDDPRTVAEYFKWWLKTHVEPRLSPTTLVRYRKLLSNVSDELGDVLLARLTAMQLEEIYAECYARMAPKTVKDLHGCVHSALATAVRLKILLFNPASACVLQVPEKHEAKAIEMDQVEAYARAAADSWVGTLLRLAADTGARRGELCALRWADLSFGSGILAISRAVVHVKSEVIVKSTKTKRTRRVPLPTSTLECLKMHRELQQVTRDAMGPDYRTDLDLIFAGPDGNFLNPGSLTRACSRIARSIGLAGATLKTLRHSHASISLASGVPLPVVSKRLGHSNSYVTATVYAHALPNDEAAAADAWQQQKLKAAERAAGQSEKEEVGPVAPIGTISPSDKSKAN